MDLEGKQQPAQQQPNQKKKGTTRGSGATAVPERPRRRRHQVFVGAILVLVSLACWVLWANEWSLYYQSATIATGQKQIKREAATAFSVAVFYHIFISSERGRKGVLDARRIVREQIQQVAQAALASQRRWTLYYTTTGNANQTLVTHEWIETVACRSRHLECVPTGAHLDVGNEDITLRHMHAYCRRRSSSSSTVETATVSSGSRHNNNDKNDRRLIVYLHSKGTYHDSDNNELWRQALTYAATHPSCLASLQPPVHNPHGNNNNSSSSNNQHTHRQQQSLCNVCGLQFYPTWTTFYPGNMFSAQCSYVRQLLEPQDEFPQRVAQVVQQVDSNDQKWTHKLYNFAHPSNLGQARFAAEHWIGSHPLLRPCDIQQGNDTVLASLRLVEYMKSVRLRRRRAWWRKLLPPSWRYTGFVYQPPLPTVATRAPRVTVEAGEWFRLKHHILQALLASSSSHNNDSRWEYFLLPGFLYRHQQLYQAYPPRDSWFWSCYPDGQLWRGKIYGNGGTNSNRNNATQLLEW